MALSRNLTIASLLVALAASSALAQQTRDGGAATKDETPKNETSARDTAKPSEKPLNPSSKRDAARELLALTPEREAAGWTFVRQHHPELADLIVVLKESRPKEYAQAMRDLYRTSERLASIQEQDAPRHELELRVWKAQSRVQLLTARITMQPTDKLREELRASLEDQYDAQLAILAREREKIADRLSGLDKQMQRLKQNRKQSIERQLDALQPRSKRPTSVSQP